MTRGRPRGGKDGCEPRARIRQREQHVLALSLQGRTQAEIAAQEHISQPAVSKILRRIDEREVKALTHERDRYRVRAVRRAEHIGRESLRAWEESKKGRVRRRQRKVAGSDGDGVVSQEVIIDEHPDPRLLEQSRRANELIVDTLGLRQTMDTSSSSAPTMPDLSPEEVLCRLQAIMDEASTAAEPPVAASPAAPSTEVTATGEKGPDLPPTSETE